MGLYCRYDSPKQVRTYSVNILSPVEEYVRQSTGPPLVHVMSLRQAALSYLSRPILTWYLYHEEHIYFNVIWIEIQMYYPKYAFENAVMKMVNTFSRPKRVSVLLTLHRLYPFISEIYSLQLHSRPDVFSLEAWLSLIALVQIETHGNYKVKHPGYLYLSWIPAACTGSQKRMMAFKC